MASETPGTTIRTPAEVSVVLVCPDCDMETAVAAKFQTRLVRDQDGDATLALRTKAAKVRHDCDQPDLGLAEGDRER